MLTLFAVRVWFADNEPFIMAIAVFATLGVLISCAAVLFLFSSVMEDLYRWYANRRPLPASPTAAGDGPKVHRPRRPVPLTPAERQGTVDFLKYGFPAQYAALVKRNDWLAVGKLLLEADVCSFDLWLTDDCPKAPCTTKAGVAQAGVTKKGDDHVRQ